MNIIHSAANCCLQCCWLEAGGSTESVITATAALLLHHRRQIIADHFRAFWHCCQAGSASTIRYTVWNNRVMHQMRKYRKLGCNTIKYDGIGRLSGVASTALSLCRAWHRCLRDSSVRRKNRQRGGCKNEDRGGGAKCKLRSMNGLDEADSHSKGFPPLLLHQGRRGVQWIILLKQVRYWHGKTCTFKKCTKSFGCCSLISSMLGAALAQIAVSRVTTLATTP